jgi:phosphatidylinositol alpha-1,6-mannosyltransferase
LPPHEAPRGLRILALVTDGFGARGGIGQYNRDLLRAWSASPEVERVIVLPRAGGGEAPPDRVVQHPARASRLRYVLTSLALLWREGPFDVVFCGHLHMAPWAALLARLAGARLWLQLHGIEAWQRPSQPLRRAAERADLVTCVSRHTRRLFLGWARNEPSTVKVLPNTVEPRFAPGPADPGLRERLGLTGHRVLLTVGRLAASERYKGHDVVLGALGALKDEMPQLVYVIAGDGDDLPRLRSAAQALGVADRVRFAGFFDDAQLPALYRSADVFVMPSTGEGFGIVFLQALACGVPVVGGDADGSRDPLRDGRSGGLVDARSVEAVAAGVRAALAGAQPAREPEAFRFPRFQAQVAALTAALPTGGSTR